MGKFPNHRPLETCCFKAFGQALDLNVIDFVTAFVPIDRIGRDIGKSLNITLQRHLMFRKFQIERYHSDLFELVTVCSNAVTEACHAHSFLPKAIEIEIRSG